MVKRASEMKTELREQMRSGKGSVELIHILNREEMKGKVRLFARIVLNPGCSIGLHEHVDEEEAYYILKGKGIVTDNGQTTEVQAGDVILTGDGGTHSIENNGDEPLEFIAVVMLYN
ncbi:cupin [Thermoclostridium stercorarium subsp. thermolacticum DSM 2910]|uniref:Cupin n=1 Tax=Thermoclostridium stercorarium subsp. thermolacticum DSM 2910 TaxID=1121336 RepID=A0A1B1YE59_THEST|nr:cupin domain-containing protein [Thermoclostridium stercorarium]ANW99037.1 cupin [Thermoclostridium stercorarium subsp. thermolacticum DSM 2910]